MHQLFKSNDWEYRLLRTIIQAIIGVIINFLPDLIAGTTVIPYEYKPIVQALVMAVLSPTMAALGGAEDAE